MTISISLYTAIRPRGHFSQMHHLANNVTRLCYNFEHDNTCRESVPMYYSSGEKAVLVVIGRSRHLSVSQRGGG